jgi:hypothetical protein
MQTENIFIAHTVNSEQENVLKTLFKALKIKFEVMKEQPYNPDYVTKIKQSKKEFESGDFISIPKEDLQQFLGL